MVRRRRLRSHRWLSSLLVIAFAVACGLMVGPPAGLSERLEARRGWFQQFGAISLELHRALASQAAGDVAAALAAADERLVAVADGMRRDARQELAPCVTALRRVRDGLTQATRQAQSEGVRHEVVADVLTRLDQLTLSLREESGPMRRRLQAAQARLRFMVSAALLLAVFTLGLMYWHARARRRIAEMTARRAADARRSDERRMESLSVLAGGVAHDFNNLLVGIMSNAELAREALASGSPGREIVEDISASASRCATISRKMLAYAGRGRQRFTPVDVNALIEQLVVERRPMLAPGHRLNCLLKPDLQRVWADRDAVASAIRSVIENAVEALDDAGGTVSIRTAMCWSAAEEGGAPRQSDCGDGDCVCVTVEDDGCGMDEHTLARVFDPFFTTKGDNRGVDLSVAYGVAQAHRGSLTADSEHGQWTRVRLILPTAGSTVVGSSRWPAGEDD